MSEQTTELTKHEQSTAQQSNGSVIYTPRFDICETEDELILYGELPGVELGDLDIQFEGKELTIHGKVSSRHGDHRPLREEYGVGDFYRTFAVGETIDAEKISAELKNGLLTLHLPKVEAAKPKRIEVKVS
jgi:HSP20 family molecular chaperone IbpA